jgi:CDP-diacylglycerol--serine O-phosphatidyltransferase
LVAGFVWIINDLNIPGEDVRWYAFALTLFCGITMVSTLPYWSGKDINLRRSVPFMVLPPSCWATCWFPLIRRAFCLPCSWAYAISGYVMAAGVGAPTSKNCCTPGVIDL